MNRDLYEQLSHSGYLLAEFEQSIRACLGLKPSPQTRKMLNEVLDSLPSLHCDLEDALIDEEVDK